MTTTQISSISEFLLHAGTEYRVFDMGRSIRPMSAQSFLEVENGDLIAPYPRLQHQWMGIVFWDKHRSASHYIWFIKLPLDEQGKVVTASRNHFLQIIVEALGAQLENAEAKNGHLPDNPYTFIPNQHQLADFNSISRKELALGTSSHFEAALRYLQTPMVIDWQSIALQGLTDFVANMDDKSYQALLLNQWLHYPTAVQHNLLTSMENHPLDESVVKLIRQWLSERADDALSWQAGLRSLCQSSQYSQVVALVQDVLRGPLAAEPGTLTVIAGRLWPVLGEDEIARAYFDAVAKADPEYALFRGVFTDLVQQTATRHTCLDMLRWPEKSAELTQAVGSLFSQMKQG